MTPWEIAWQHAQATLAHLYRGRTIANSDPASVQSDMAFRQQQQAILAGADLVSPAPIDHLEAAYQKLLGHIAHLAAELAACGVDLSPDNHPPTLTMTNDTREIYEAMSAAIVRAVGLRGILRRRAAKGSR